MPTELEKMLAGELYNPYDADLVRMRDRARDLCIDLNHLRSSEEAQRRMILGELLGAGGYDVSLNSPFYCDYGSNIFFGKKCFLNFNCVLLDTCKITIGDYTLLGPGVQIYTATHPLDATERRKVESGKPITIGSDVWIGGGAIICPGVTIGSRAVIGAGSVVTRDIPDDVVAVGNPCRVIRKLATRR